MISEDPERVKRNVMSKIQLYNGKYIIAIYVICFCSLVSKIVRGHIRPPPISVGPEAAATVHGLAKFEASNDPMEHINHC